MKIRDSQAIVKKEVPLSVIFEINIDLRQTSIFEKWFSKLNNQAKEQIAKRLDKASAGLGDNKYLRDNVYEFKIAQSPGYRVYYTIRDKGSTAVLLWGGKKDDQERDIKKAIKLEKEINDENQTF